MTGVSSVDPSSMTTNSLGRSDCSAREVSCSARNIAPLYVAIATDMTGTSFGAETLRDFITWFRSAESLDLKASCLRRLGILRACGVCSTANPMMSAVHSSVSVSSLGLRSQRPLNSQRSGPSLAARATLEQLHSSIGPKSSTSVKHERCFISHQLPIETVVVGRHHHQVCRPQLLCGQLH